MPRTLSSPPLSAPTLFPSTRPLSITALAAAAVAFLAVAVALQPPLQAASALLESVKQNPALAKQLCGQFKALNAQGKSATSKESIAMVASSQNLSPVDAEVLTTYVIGLHCPDVR